MVKKNILMYWRNITVRRQLMFACGLSVTLLLGLCAYGIVQLNATNRQTSRLSNVDLPALQAVNRLYVGFLKISYAEQFGKITEEGEWDSVDKIFKSLISYDLTVEEFDRLQRLQRMWHGYRKNPDIDFDWGKLESALVTLEESIAEEVRLRSIGVNELFSITRQRIFLLLVFGSGIIAAFYYLLAKRFLAPLNRGLGLVRAMQRGDLSARIDIKDNNEIGELCQALNNACVALAAKAKLEREQNEKIYQANKLISLGTLVAGVAHEINNPNSNITFNTPLLRSLLEELFDAIACLGGNTVDLSVAGLEYAEMQEDLLGMVDTIEKSACRIKSIVAGLRDYSRPVVEGDTFVRIDLQELVVRTFELVGKQLERDIGQVEKCFSEKKIYILGNFIRLEQVLVNLIHNAREAMFGIAESTLWVRVYELEGKAVLEVEDNGVGIDPDIIDRVTDPFFTTKRAINGTGLGLSVVASILGEHNAQIEFASQLSGGTRVEVRFNIA